MTKLKYILIIVGSALVGLVIGWFIWSGGQITLNIADVTIKVDTLKNHTDTLLEHNKTIVFKPVAVHDTTYNTVYDTIYQFNLKDALIALQSENKPYEIHDGLFLSTAFEFRTTFYDRDDTLLYSFMFPGMSPELIVKHGIDSILYKERTIYKDYWFDAWYVQVPIYTAAFGAGALINSGDK